MKTILAKLVLLPLLFISLNAYCQENKSVIDSIKMNLNNFSMPCYDCPSISVYINFIKDSSNCYRSFYDPKEKSSHYVLNKAEIDSILMILTTHDLEKLKSQYSVSVSDLPTSTITIYAGKRKFEIKDYGLKGEPPLQQLYKIVYK